MLGRFRYALAFVSALQFTAASPVKAQTVAFNPSVMVGWTGGAAVDDDIQRRAGRRRATVASAPSFRSLGRSALARASGSVPAARVSYRPDPAARQRNLQQFAARIGARDAKAGAELKRAFASRDLIGEIGGSMRSNGLNPNNVADTMALYLVTAWNGVRGSDQTMPTATYRAVSRQMAQGIGATQGFATASDALKQEIAESMMVQALLAEQAIASAKGNPGTMAQVRTALGQGAKSTFGFDLARMQLTANGLR